MNFIDEIIQEKVRTKACSHTCSCRKCKAKKQEEEEFFFFDTLFNLWGSPRPKPKPTAPPRQTKAGNLLNPRRLRSAVNYNQRNGDRVGWKTHRDEIVRRLLKLNYTPNDEEFAQRIADWQAKNGYTGGAIDGKLGPLTWRKIRRKLLIPNPFVGLWKNKAWDKFAMQGVEELGNNLLSVIPKDINNFCPNYLRFNREKRKQFWVILLSAMAKYESGFKPHTQYQESFGPISRGLLQISIRSANQPRYQAPRLNRKSVDILREAADLHDPEKNLRAGIRILNYWLGQHKRIGGSYRKRSGGWGHYGGAKYWSVLRSSKSRSKLPKIQALVKDSDICQ